MSPRELKRFVVFGFASTHDALDAESLLEDMGIDVVPVPAPPDLGGLCGIGLRVDPADEKRAGIYLQRAEIGVVGSVSIEDF